MLFFVVVGKSNLSIEYELFLCTCCVVVCSKRKDETVIEPVPENEVWVG
jgi:hypothetical protein